MRYEPEIYRGGVAEVLDLIRSIPDEYLAVLLVGHNPTLSALSSELDPATTTDSDGLSTCGLAVHEVAQSWAALGPGGARLVAAHTPRA